MNLISAMIRPRLEYSAIAWSPHKKNLIKNINRLQRAVTNIVPILKDLTYEQLKRQKLEILENRREKGDLKAK